MVSLASFCCCFLLVLTGGKVEAQSARPNILVIITDQQSATDLSIAGNKWVKTPNMDQLAREGFRFTTAYAADPVCVPSKFTMQTGLYASEVGVRYNEEEPDQAKNDQIIQRQALGWTFRRAGYETVFGGKIHLPGHFFGPISQYGYYQLGANGQIGADESAVVEKKLVLEMWSDPTLLANAGAKYLLNRKPDAAKPFFLFLSFESPIHDICYYTIRTMEPDSVLAKHTPEDILRLENQMHELEQSEGMDKFFSHPSPDAPGFDRTDYAPPLPVNFEPMKDEPQAIRNLIALRPFRAKARKVWDERGWREHRWMYAQLTDKQDVFIGTVLDALKKSGLATNTIVVFFSDHGENNGSHRLDHKTVFYNEASQVPFIFSGAGIAAGLTNNIPVSLADFYPTLCDLAGVKAPRDLPGISLKPCLYGEPSAVLRKYVFVENQIGFMVTDGRFKYAWYDDAGNDEMFIDLKKDPAEEVNLMPEIRKGGSEYRTEYVELRGALLKHIQQLMKAGAPIHASGLQQLIEKDR